MSAATTPPVGHPSSPEEGNWVTVSFGRCFDSALRAPLNMTETAGENIAPT